MKANGNYETGIHWPIIDSKSASPLAALLREMDMLERASVDEISEGQQRQLLALTRHAATYSSHFSARMEKAGLQPDQGLTLETLSKLPLLTRRELQVADNDFFCTSLPSIHRPVHETQTSGSSGEPVVVRRTEVTQLFWLASTMREHYWWNRDFTGVLAIIRANLGQTQYRQESWGPPVSLLAPSGPAHALSMAIDSAEQARRLCEINPHYLLTYPNNLAALLKNFTESARHLPRLTQIRTVGETLNADLRTEARKVLGVEIVDTYSSQEVGVIATQCPDSGLYHLAADNLIVEVLNQDGTPCGDGETGAVVVTDLHNYATPLVRYAIGDHAEVGPRCSCGRTSPTLRRVVGRSRNMVVFPDGTKRWPMVGFHRYRSIAPVVQYQLIQHTLHHIEVRLVTERPLISTEEDALRGAITEAIGYPFFLSFSYFEKIPSGLNFKFEEFICNIKD